VTASTRIGHDDLPRSIDVPHPATRLLVHGRGSAGGLVRRYYDVTQYDTEKVPATGPVLLVANHISFIDGPLMALLAPRPVHVLTKIEMFRGPLGAFLRGAGQIAVRRGATDTTAIRSSLKVLRDGGVVGVFPEGKRGEGRLEVLEPGAAYLAIATGASVCPVIFLGTREPGSRVTSVPPRRTRIAITYGDPLRFEPHGWPRRRDEVREATAQIRNALLDTLRCAVKMSGINLPGAAPDGEVEE